MTFCVVTWDEFQRRLSPFDKRLPKSADHARYEEELGVMQNRFREYMANLAREDEDWEFPPSYQDVRVFYVYLNSSKLYTPTFASSVAKAMRDYDESWIAELECYDPPDNPGGVSFLAYHNSEFWLDDSPESVALMERLRAK